MNMSAPDTHLSPTEKLYKWRINLAKTEKHWVGWFKGLSAAFLSIPVPKMLLLAGVDRLDKELTVGQMQGNAAILKNFTIHKYIIRFLFFRKVPNASFASLWPCGTRGRSR